MDSLYNFGITISQCHVKLGDCHLPERTKRSLHVRILGHAGILLEHHIISRFMLMKKLRVDNYAREINIGPVCVAVLQIFTINTVSVSHVFMQAAAITSHLTPRNLGASCYFTRFSLSLFRERATHLRGRQKQKYVHVNFPVTKRVTCTFCLAPVLFFTQTHARKRTRVSSLLACRRVSHSCSNISSSNARNGEFTFPSRSHGHVLTIPPRD